jgi:hypothetical protein
MMGGTSDSEEWRSKFEGENHSEIVRDYRLPLPLRCDWFRKVQKGEVGLENDGMGYIIDLNLGAP